MVDITDEIVILFGDAFDAITTDDEDGILFESDSVLCPEVGCAGKVS